MDVNVINPFIESVQELFSTMLNCKVERGKIRLGEAVCENQEVAALIGMTGETARGAVALFFPQETAIKAASRFMMMEIDTVSEPVLDAVAEMVNIIAGGAKAKLADGEEPIKLGLPNVVQGKGYSIFYPSQSVWVEVPFTSELGVFSLRVAYSSSNGQNRRGSR